MSGILLPGQEKKPQASSGLEVASGFGRKEKPAPAAAPTPEQAPASQPASPPSMAQPAAPQPQRGGRQAPDFLFPPQPAQVQCPNCGNPFVVPIFSIIDLSANPELKMPLLSGQVNLAQCPQCGAGGPLSAPLMVHYPEKEFLAAYIPSQARITDTQRQKMIGDLTQAIMRRIPNEARKGYMLQPKQFVDWQRFSEKLWEFEGVTAEQLRRQRAQSELLQSLLALANDRKALELSLGRAGDLVDRTFFAMLDRMLVMASGQGQGDPFVLLRNQLIELTPVGQQVKAQQDRLRAILDTIKPDTTREQLLNLLDEVGGGADGVEMTGALVSSLAPALDYQFLVALSERIEKTSDEQHKERLDGLRQMILSIHEQQRQNQQMAMQQIQQVLQEVLQAENVEQKLQELAEYIDETFLGVLATNIRQAEQRGSKAAAHRLQDIYDKAIAMIEQGMPPDVRLVNQLLMAENSSEIGKLLADNHALLTPELVETIKHLEGDMRENQRTEVADKLKSLRGQIALRM